jgi:hypothetical protein
MELSKVMATFNPKSELKNQKLSYLPPPAQAQAQPAHAHAHAQERPPPPPPLRLFPLAVGLGNGFVAPVTLSVKVLRFPTTFCEKVCTPVTICAAISAPGSAERPMLVG